MDLLNVPVQGAGLGQDFGAVRADDALDAVLLLYVGRQVLGLDPAHRAGHILGQPLGDVPPEPMQVEKSFVGELEIAFGAIAHFLGDGETRLQQGVVLGIVQGKFLTRKFVHFYQMDLKQQHDSLFNLNSVLFLDVTATQHWKYF